MNDGTALSLILDGEPRLAGLVTLQRSRNRWYAATPWANAVTGAHPIAVLNQAFQAKGIAAGAELLEFFTEIRRFETIEIERRADNLVRITVRNAVRGCSAWPNLEGEELSSGLLDAQYHDLRLSLYPLGLELERTIAFAARWARSKCSTCGGLGEPFAAVDAPLACWTCGAERGAVQDHLDDYELQLLRGWCRRWLRQQRRIAGDPELEAWAPAIEAHVEKLGGILRIGPGRARELAVPPTRVGSSEFVEVSGRPAFFPCGCSRAKVDLGRCDAYKPGESP